MTRLPKLGHMLDRFNQGCAFFQKALDSWKRGDISGYETALRTAATEAIGALEWALKIYLRNLCRDRMAPSDRAYLKQPNFDDLMTLMQKYADPAMGSRDVSLLYDYRDLFRNAAEHDGSVPPSQELCDVLQKVRSIVLTYLPIREDELGVPSMALSSIGPIQELKAEYFETLRSRYEYMDLGGISPRVGSKVVKIRMKDLFIPLRAREEEALYESFTEGPDEATAFDRSDIPASSGEITVPDDDLSTEVDELSAEEVALVRYRRLDPGPIEMSDILEKPKVVVLGHPGSGKTTIGKYIAYSIAVGQFGTIGQHLAQHIPVIIKAAEYADSAKADSTLSFYNYVSECCTSKYGTLIKWALANGQCLVIIDGLDEIPDPRLRVLTCRRIEAFVSEFQRNRFLVTSRIVGYRQNQLTGDFTHVMLSELDEEQVLAFLRQWYKAIETEAEPSIVDEADIARRAAGLWEAIEANPGIVKLARNPLLLTIIALANWRGTKLPNRRVELYQIATETLVENWPLKQRGVALDSEEILSILEPIAHQILVLGKNNLITEHDLRPLFESQVCEVRGVSSSDAKTLSRELLQTIELDTGFFLAKGFDQSNRTLYGFLHLTFAEYLAARFLAEQWSSDQLDFHLYAHNDRWHEVLLLMAGHIGTWATAQATRLVKDVLQLKSPYEVHIKRDLLLAAEILGDNVRVRRELQDDVVSQLLSLALHTPHVSLWRTIVNRLSDISRVVQLGEPVQRLRISESDNIDMQARKAVLHMMIAGDTTDEVLRALLQGLTQPTETRGFVQPFVHAAIVLEDQEDSTHLFAAQTSSGAYAVPVSRRTASRISSLALPINGTESLLQQQSDTGDNSTYQLWLLSVTELLSLSIHEMVRLLSKAASPRVFLVSMALGFGDSRVSVCDQLVKHIASDSSSDLRISALDSLETLLSIRFFYPSTGSDSDSRRRWVDSVRPLVTPSEDPAIHAKALRVLLTLSRDSTEWTEPLCQALTDPSELVRATGARLAFRYRDSLPDVVRSQLQTLLGDASPEVRMITARTLIRVDTLADRDAESWIRILFADRLESTQAGSTSELLDDLLILADRVRSPHTLNEIENRVRELLQRETAVSAEQAPFYWSPGFSERRPRTGKGLTGMISKLLDDPNPVVKGRSIAVWSRIRTEGLPTAQWVSLLEDDDRNVRLSAITALRRLDLQQEGITMRLIRYLYSEDKVIAGAAASALSRVRDMELREKVINEVTALLDQDPSNTSAYDVLWSLIPPSEGWDEIPF